MNRRSEGGKIGDGPDAKALVLKDGLSAAAPPTPKKPSALPIFCANQSIAGMRDFESTHVVLALVRNAG